MARSEEKRRAAHVYGLRAETVAALWLRLKLYRILARRYRTQDGEVDIIAQRGDVVAFVEVKARGDLDAAQIAITPQKRRRFSRAAGRWMATHPWAASHTLRADAVFVAPRRLPLHVEAAFEMELG